MFSSARVALVVEDDEREGVGDEGAQRQARQGNRICYSNSALRACVCDESGRYTVLIFVFEEWISALWMFVEDSGGTSQHRSIADDLVFCVAMGNEKSNNYWEAELPPNHNRDDTENFIRLKYEGKRWIPKKETQFTPKPEERNSNFNSELKGGNSSGHSNNYKESSHVETHARNIAQETPMTVLAGQTVSATPNSRQPSSCAEKNNNLDANGSSTDSRSSSDTVNFIYYLNHKFYLVELTDELMGEKSVLVNAIAARPPRWSLGILEQGGKCLMTRAFCLCGTHTYGKRGFIKLKIMIYSMDAASFICLV
ncbi:hypothetical protein Scep_015930 [Stephania cephalantha]|uniref:Uncharacterized protein n=1 Tax=Stephania cephalantha TaxID=152367 RepID=A0AAP0ILX5_9MAGN